MTNSLELHLDNFSFYAYTKDKSIDKSSGLGAKVKTFNS